MYAFKGYGDVDSMASCI